MYIEEVIIDGFKSYAARTHIMGWDPEFNAITGLNGSGKSNILDAICFALGLSELSKVRAGNLQDLVYKRGQAGITKASVTLVFNNSEPSKSPIGYEHAKTITVTRQFSTSGHKKYIINGHHAQQQALANLFQKITKVLNMKPPEILAMIEEAAGTRMFEERKEKALKTMGKKEKKLEEIKTEKKSYLEYQKIEYEFEFTRKLVTAYQYTLNENKLKDRGQDYEAKKVGIQRLEQDVERTQHEIDTIEHEVKRILDLKAQRGDLAALEARVKESTLALVRLKTKLDLKDKSIFEEETRRTQETKALEEQTAMLADKREQTKEIQQAFSEAQEEHEREVAKFEKDRELLQTLKTGISAKEGHESGYMQQIQAEKRRVAKLESEIEQSTLQLEHLARELEKLKKDQSQAAYGDRELLANKQAAEAALRKLEQAQANLNYDHEGEMGLNNELREHKARLRELREEKNKLGSHTNHLEFQYKDPYPNFDRSKVKGLVAELFTVDDDRYTTALELCAGGKLYNVVVDTAETGSALITHQCLKTRVTIIPLDKISAFRLSAEKIADASRISPGNVNIALRLVGYDDELAEAMAFVFGGTFVCNDQDLAKEVSTERRIGRSVTLEGDIYETSGTLQGGFKPESSNVIRKFAQLQHLKAGIRACEDNIQLIQRKLQALHSASKEYLHIQKQMELESHKIQLLDKQLSSSSFPGYPASERELNIQLTEQTIENTNLACKEASASLQEALARIKHLESEKLAFESDKGSKLKEMEASLKAAKLALNSKTKRFREHKEKAQALQFELNDIEADIKAKGSAIESIEASLLALNQEKGEIASKVEETQASLNELEKELKEQQNQHKKVNKELKELEKLKQHKVSYQSTLQLDIQKLQHEIERFEKDFQDAERIAFNLRALTPRNFNKEDSNFDFSKYDMKECAARLQALEKQHDSLRKKINLKVMTLIEGVEKKEANLKHMLNTVKKDKRTIEGTIVQLDEYKKEALQKTWEKVSVDFGAIFAELLPGNSAKLVIPEGQELMDGLEVRVNLGGVWKHSLTELSGGQRSLIALSLILSLLQFKPAPMYILDEIDAALDLSHTQNIGQLLRTRFKGSQFIIVSLKDGMFNNANVLFKARFKDGVSMVERIVAKR
ncbi:Structural maintenance of chromosomes protein 2 [Massospora cicadina]|nr:Structural maintenance of chromosomes protein 2 [Massospora cicadina]